MRCEKCRKEITGIGKPAISPALPALLAWGGIIWAMWSLTLGENPLPSWTPTTGWAVGMGTLVAVSILSWFVVTRRKCPECGSTRMLQAMEEESVLATERQMAKEQAAGGLSAGAEAELRQAMGRAVRAEIEVELRQTMAKTLRAEVEAELRKTLGSALRVEVEAELRATSAKETGELRGRLEKQLRDEIGQQLRAGQAESEKGLHQRLASELRPEIEKELRPHIEEKLRPEIENALRPRIEEKLRPEIERELQPRIEEKLRSEIEKELRPRVEKELRPRIEQELRASLKKEAPAEPERPKTSPPVVESAAKVSPEIAKESGKPAAGATLILGAQTATSLAGLSATVGRAAPARSTPAPMTKTPVVEVSKSAKAETASLPVAKGERSSLPRISQVTPTPVAVGSLAGKPSVAAGALTPAPVSVKAAAPTVSKGAGAAPTPSPGRLAVTPGPFAMDPHERALRRARVIVSDLSLYHKDVLAQAAQAADGKQALGTLWRDAVLAYDRTVPLEVRNTTHYLEEELERHLAKVRQSQARPQQG